MITENRLLYPIGCSTACQYTVRQLQNNGIAITDHPSPETTHLLLDVPSFSSEGFLRCGIEIRTLLETLPESITVIGGMLQDPSLDGYHTYDLLNDEEYLIRNAQITAQCALMLAGSKLNTTLPQTPILILGWGRIGKLLAKDLQQLGATPMVYARNPKDRALLRTLGHQPVDEKMLPQILPDIRLLINTIPAPVLTQEQADLCHCCLKLDLASVRGIPGNDVLHERGLPGRYVPQSSGKLIADTILRIFQEEAK